jgi:hypothetical protein
LNKNRIATRGFSNPDTEGLYRKQRPIDGRIQCGGCSFYAGFNQDYGLCCYPKSKFYLETVFEHFGCDKHVTESWESHSFKEHPCQLIDRSHLLSLLGRCENAIGGKKGTGIISRDIRILYLEIKALLGGMITNNEKRT